MNDLTKLTAEELAKRNVLAPGVREKIRRRLARLEKCEALLQRSLALALHVGAYPLVDDLQDAIAARAAVEG